jgi:hypothetical protein
MLEEFSGKGECQENRPDPLTDPLTSVNGQNWNRLWQDWKKPKEW